jgi:hypothetical protein
MAILSWGLVVYRHRKQLKRFLAVSGAGKLREDHFANFK